MDILFLDANVLFSAAYRKTAGISTFWELPNVQLISSYYALEEAERNLSQTDQLARLKALSGRMEMQIEYDEDLIPPSVKLRGKDRPILASAIGASANYLITGDVRDFGAYFGKSLCGVLILPPAEYLKRRQK